MEKFVSVPGWPNREISSLGYVRNKKTGRKLYGTKITTGYMQVRFRESWNGVRTERHLMHRLVYRCFNPDIMDENMVVNHIDGDRTNNVLSNLNQLTIRDNVIDGIRRRTERRKNKFT